MIDHDFGYRAASMTLALAALIACDKSEPCRERSAHHDGGDDHIARERLFA
jgi:hypothetical protein